MNLYIIRHAEPDYSCDSLTEKGWREAALLAPRLAKIPDAQIYVSPLGRAQATASLLLKQTGAQAQTLGWLREFDQGYRLAGDVQPVGIGWDLLPQTWAEEPQYYDPEGWREAPVYRDTGVGEAYDRVIAGLDALLAAHGYVRDGHVYRVERPNCENILLFCHFGLESVLLSRLLDCSPVVLWHHTVALPSSVTVLSTEERRRGTAVFRMSRFGDLSHLDAAGEPASFHARFCERAGDGTRED